MAEVKIMKAVEWDKLSAAFKKKHGSVDALAVAGFWAQKKYDGCFGMAVLKADGSAFMRSRTAEDYTDSCIHILKELRHALDDHQIAEGVFLGEVWNAELPFPTISGLFRQQRRIATELGFVVNDFLPMTLQTTRPYRLRYGDLMQILGEEDGFATTVAQTWQEHQWGSATGMANQFKAEGGFDGAIVRDPDAGYTIGLVKNGEIIKVKPVMSLDLKVVELTEEVGEKTGRPVYTITVEHRGVRSEVGSGMPHVLPANLVLGAIVEIECMGLTDEGKLREPRFKGVRIDKTEPDA